jgi:hypothetical protein
MGYILGDFLTSSSGQPASPGDLINIKHFCDTKIINRQNDNIFIVLAYMVWWYLPPLIGHEFDSCQGAA